MMDVKQEEKLPSRANLKHGFTEGAGLADRTVKMLLLDQEFGLAVPDSSESAKSEIPVYFCEIEAMAKLLSAPTVPLASFAYHSTLAATSKQEGGLPVFTGQLLLSYKLSAQTVRTVDMGVRFRVLGAARDQGKIDAKTGKRKLNAVREGHESSDDSDKEVGVKRDAAKQKRPSNAAKSFGSSPYKDERKCRIPAKQFERLLDTTSVFLPRVRRLLQQLLRNQNFRDCGGSGVGGNLSGQRNNQPQSAKSDKPASKPPSSTVLSLTVSQNPAKRSNHSPNVSADAHDSDSGHHELDIGKLLLSLPLVIAPGPQSLSDHCMLVYLRQDSAAHAAKETAGKSEHADSPQLLVARIHLDFVKSRVYTTEAVPLYSPLGNPGHETGTWVDGKALDRPFALILLHLCGIAPPGTPKQLAPLDLVLTAEMLKPPASPTKPSKASPPDREQIQAATLALLRDRLIADMLTTAGPPVASPGSHRHDASPMVPLSSRRKALERMARHIVEGEADGRFKGDHEDLQDWLSRGLVFALVTVLCDETQLIGHNNQEEERVPGEDGEEDSHESYARPFVLESREELHHAVTACRRLTLIAEGRQKLLHMFAEHISKHCNCVGVWHALHLLLVTEPLFCADFVRLHGCSKLMEFHQRLSTAFLGSNWEATVKKPVIVPGARHDDSSAEHSHGPLSGRNSHLPRMPSKKFGSVSSKFRSTLPPNMEESEHPLSPPPPLSNSGDYKDSAAKREEGTTHKQKKAKRRRHGAGRADSLDETELASVARERDKEREKDVAKQAAAVVAVTMGVAAIATANSATPHRPSVIQRSNTKPNRRSLRFSQRGSTTDLHHELAPAPVAGGGVAPPSGSKRRTWGNESLVRAALSGAGLNVQQSLAVPGVLPLTRALSPGKQHNGPVPPLPLDLLFSKSDQQPTLRHTRRETMKLTNRTQRRSARNREASNNNVSRNGNQRSNTEDKDAPRRSPDRGVGGDLRDRLRPPQRSIGESLMVPSGEQLSTPDEPRGGASDVRHFALLNIRDIGEAMGQAFVASQITTLLVHKQDFDSDVLTVQNFRGTAATMAATEQKTARDPSAPTASARDRGDNKDRNPARSSGSGLFGSASGGTRKRNHPSMRIEVPKEHVAEPVKSGDSSGSFDSLATTHNRATMAVACCTSLLMRCLIHVVGVHPSSANSVALPRTVSSVSQLRPVTNVLFLQLLACSSPRSLFSLASLSSTTASFTMLAEQQTIAAAGAISANPFYGSHFRSLAYTLLRMGSLCHPPVFRPLSSCVATMLSPSVPPARLATLKWTPYKHVNWIFVPASALQAIEPSLDDNPRQIPSRREGFLPVLSTEGLAVVFNMTMPTEQPNLDRKISNMAPSKSERDLPGSGAPQRLLSQGVDGPAEFPIQLTGRARRHEKVGQLGEVSARGSHDEKDELAHAFESASEANSPNANGRPGRRPTATARSHIAINTHRPDHPAQPPRWVVTTRVRDDVFLKRVTARLVVCATNLSHLTRQSKPQVYLSVMEELQLQFRLFSEYLASCGSSCLPAVAVKLCLPSICRIKKQLDRIDNLLFGKDTPRFTGPAFETPRESEDDSKRDGLNFSQNIINRINYHRMMVISYLLEAWTSLLKLSEELILDRLLVRFLFVADESEDDGGGENEGNPDDAEAAGKEESDRKSTLHKQATLSHLAENPTPRTARQQADATRIQLIELAVKQGQAAFAPRAFGTPMAGDESTDDKSGHERKKEKHLKDSDEPSKLLPSELAALRDRSQESVTNFFGACLHLLARLQRRKPSTAHLAKQQGQRPFSGANLNRTQGLNDILEDTLDDGLLPPGAATGRGGARREARRQRGGADSLPPSNYEPSMSRQRSAVDSKSGMSPQLGPMGSPGAVPGMRKPHSSSVSIDEKSDPLGASGSFNPNASGPLPEGDELSDDEAMDEVDQHFAFSEALWSAIATFIYPPSGFFYRALQRSASTAAGLDVDVHGPMSPSWNAFSARSAAGKDHSPLASPGGHKGTGAGGAGTQHLQPPAKAFSPSSFSRSLSGGLPSAHSGQAGGGHAHPTGPPVFAAPRVVEAIHLFLRDLFLFPSCPFLRSDVVSHYISFHYIAFIRVYHAPNFDEDRAKLCSMHLDVLLALASAPPRAGKDADPLPGNRAHRKARKRHKNMLPVAIAKFLKLRVVRFLAREINLEHEATQQQVTTQMQEGGKAQTEQKKTDAPAAPANNASANGNNSGGNGGNNGNNPGGMSISLPPSVSTQLQRSNTMDKIAMFKPPTMRLSLPTIAPVTVTSPSVAPISKISEATEKASNKNADSRPQSASVRSDGSEFESYPASEVDEDDKRDQPAPLRALGLGSIGAGTMAPLPKFSLPPIAITANPHNDETQDPGAAKASLTDRKIEEVLQTQHTAQGDKETTATLVKLIHSANVSPEIGGTNRTSSVRFDSMSLGPLGASPEQGKTDRASMSMGPAPPTPMTITESTSSGGLLIRTDPPPGLPSSQSQRSDLNSPNDGPVQILRIDPVSEEKQDELRSPSYLSPSVDGGSNAVSPAGPSTNRTGFQDKNALNSTRSSQAGHTGNNLATPPDNKLAPQTDSLKVSHRRLHSGDSNASKDRNGKGGDKDKTKESGDDDDSSVELSGVWSESQSQVEPPPAKGKSPQVGNFSLTLGNIKRTDPSADADALLQKLAKLPTSLPEAALPHDVKVQVAVITPTPKHPVHPEQILAEHLSNSPPHHVSLSKDQRTLLAAPASHLTLNVNSNAPAESASSTPNPPSSVGSSRPSAAGSSNNTKFGDRYLRPLHGGDSDETVSIGSPSHKASSNPSGHKGDAKLEHSSSMRSYSPAAGAAHTEAPREHPVLPPVDTPYYKRERANRRIYAHSTLHIALVRLLMRLIVAPNGHSLNSLYCSRLPLTRKKPGTNVAFLLHLHLNHPLNEAILPALLDLEMSPHYFETMSVPRQFLATDTEARFDTQGRLRGRVRLLKLLCEKLFHPGIYTKRKRLGKGRYGQVHEAFVSHSNEKLAIKQVDVPRGIEEQCNIFDMFTEVAILEKFKYHRGVCHLYDYGVSGGSYWLVLRAYNTSLRSWRHRQLGEADEESIVPPKLSQLKRPERHRKTASRNFTGFSHGQLRLYLDIFREILRSMMSLADEFVMHFDLKCDNVLIETYDKGQNSPSIDRRARARSASSAEGMQLTRPGNIPFSVCLADFGESMIGQKGSKVLRGTENIQSPEMLALDKVINKEHQNYDRRRDNTADAASDVWSLGCLFYELITGDFLYQEKAGCPIFLSVTAASMPVLTEEAQQLLQHNTHLISFLQFVLVRDKVRRPTLEEVMYNFEMMYSQLFPNKKDHQPRESKNDEKKPHLPFELLNVQSPEPLYRPPSRGNPKPMPSLPEREVMSAAVNQATWRRAMTPTSQNEMRNKRNITDAFIHALTSTKPFSRITQHLYVGAMPTKSSMGILNDLNITHLVNCSDDVGDHASHAIYHSTTFFFSDYSEERANKRPSTDFPNGNGNGNQSHEPSASVQAQPVESKEKRASKPGNPMVRRFELCVEFMRNAVRHNGRVLIYSEKGISRAPAVAVAFLMDTYALSFLEALSFVNQRRPITEPNTVLADAIVQWINQPTSRAKRQEPLHYSLRDSRTVSYSYRCLCGACVYTLTQAPYVGETSPVQCPHPLSCTLSVCQMENLYGLPCAALMWGFSYSTLTFSELSRFESTIKYDPFAEYGIAPDMAPSKAENKSGPPWQLYSCRVCHYLMFASRAPSIEPLSALSSPLSPISGRESRGSMPTTQPHGNGIGVHPSETTPEGHRHSSAVSAASPYSLAVVTNLINWVHHQPAPEDENGRQRLDDVAASQASLYQYDQRPRVFFTRLAGK